MIVLVCLYTDDVNANAIFDKLAFRQLTKEHSTFIEHTHTRLTS